MPRIPQIRFLGPAGEVATPVTVEVPATNIAVASAVPSIACGATVSAPATAIAVAALALAGDHVDRAALNTHGFRFGKVLDYRDPMFLPGGSKYLDLPGMLSLSDRQKRWVTGENEERKGQATDWLMQ